MAGKKGTAEQRRGKGSEPRSDASPPTSSSRRKGRRGDSWPWWLWVVGALGLLCCLGRIFAGPPGNSSGKKDKGGDSKAASTQQYLNLALKLQDLSNRASVLEASGTLDEESAKEFREELAELEAEIDGADKSMARDLHSMVSVLRGTLIQRTEKLSDDEVEERGGSYTYANWRYWDDYYNKTDAGEKYDWYGTWDAEVHEIEFKPRGVGAPVKATRMSHLIAAYLDPKSRILMFGCGNSDMSEKMYTDGYQDIMNIDISDQLLKNLRDRLGKKHPKMTWKLENVSALSFESGSFDVTLDKGTLDAIEQNQPLLQAAVAEAHRTLRPGGVFLSVTFNAPHVRVDGHLMKAAPWGACHTHEFDRKFHTGKTSRYYLHACQLREE